MGKKKKTAEVDKLLMWTLVYVVGFILLLMVDFIGSLYRHNPQNAVFFLIAVYVLGYAIYRTAIR